LKNAVFVLLKKDVLKTSLHGQEKTVLFNGGKKAHKRRIKKCGNVKASFLRLEDVLRVRVLEMRKKAIFKTSLKRLVPAGKCQS